MLSVAGVEFRMFHFATCTRTSTT